MRRTRLENEALAQVVAQHLLALFHHLQTKRLFSVDLDTLRIYEHALTLVDRKELWSLYLRARAKRTTAGQRAVASSSAPGVDIGPDTPAPILSADYYTWAFLARTMVTPAAALSGRAQFFLSLYLKEGIQYASHLAAPDNAAERRGFCDTWSAVTLTTG